jgi:hypothetical protein
VITQSPWSPTDDELDRLRRHLADHAHRSSITTGGLAVVVRSAKCRTRRRRIATTIAASIAVIGGTSVVAARVTDHEPHRLILVDQTVHANPTLPPTSILPTVPAPSTAVESTQRWVAHDIATDVVVSKLRPDSVAGNGPLVGWTTDESGSASVESDLYWSADGISWQPTATSPQLNILAATASSGTIAVLGFNDATPGTAAVMVKLSADDGQTWRTIGVPAEFPQLRGESSVAHVFPKNISIAFSDRTIVASFGVSVDLDDRLFSAEQLRQARRYTTSGVELLVPCDAPCDPSTTEVASLITWTELGVSATVVEAVLSQPRLYVSADEQPFEALAAGPMADGSSIAAISMTWSGDAYLATTEPASAPMHSDLWRSNDGTSWARIGWIPAQATAFAMVAGHYAIFEPIAGVWLSDDGTAWRQSDLAGTLDPSGEPGSVNFASIDGAGITLVGTPHRPPVPDTEIIRNGIIATFHLGGDGDISFVDQSTGADLGRVTSTPFDNGIVRALGDGHVDVLDDTGNVRATFSPDDMTLAVNNAAAAQPATEEVIVHSDDGIGWSTTSVNELTGGRPNEIAWIRTIGTATAIGIFLDNEPGLGEDGRVLKALIGTPNG